MVACCGSVDVAARMKPWRAGMAGLPSRPAVLDEFGYTIAETSAGEVEHIASWHPLIALAVADWLEVRAREYDGMARGPFGLAGVAFVSGAGGAGDADPALAVARAYLGTERDVGKLEAVPGE